MKNNLPVYGLKGALNQVMMDEIYRMLSEGHYDELLNMIKQRMKTYNVTIRLIRKKLSIRRRAFFRLISGLETGKLNNSDFFNIQKLVLFLDISIDDIPQLYERMAHSCQLFMKPTF